MLFACNIIVNTYYVKLLLPEKCMRHLLKAIIRLPISFIYEIKRERFLKLSEENRVILFFNYSANCHSLPTYLGPLYTRVWSNTYFPDRMENFTRIVFEDGSYVLGPTFVTEKLLLLTMTELSGLTVNSQSYGVK